MIQKFEYHPPLIVAGYVDVGLYLYYFCIFRFWKEIDVKLDDTPNVKSEPGCHNVLVVTKSCKQYKYTYTYWLSAYVYQPDSHLRVN